MRSRIPHARPGDEDTCAVPAQIVAIGVAGGVGASTLCALIAQEIAAKCAARVVVADLADRCSPWPEWTDADGHLHASPNVQVDLGGPDGPEPAGTVRIIDLGRRTEQATTPGALLLAVRGSADGITAAQRAIEDCRSLGVDPQRITPVVIAATAGRLAPRVRSRLTLLDPQVRPAITVPFDPALSRRGLVDALAAGAVHRSTRLAVHQLLQSLPGPLDHRVPALLSATIEGIPA